MSTRRAIATAAAVVMMGGVLSRVLGIVREQVIADRFGATATTSSFVAATTVPTMVYDLLIGGAISSALVPVFSEYVVAGRDLELRRIVGTVMSIAAVLLGVLAGLMVLFAGPVVEVLVPGLDPAIQRDTVTLTQIALPSVVFFGLAGVSSALLNSRGVFSYPAFSVGIYNVGIIAAALLLANYIGPVSLVLGVIAGALLQLLVQLTGLRRRSTASQSGSWPIFSLDLRNPAVLRILKLYAPVALGLMVSQIGVIIDRNLASRTGDESLAVLRFATTLVQLPVGLIVVATTTAVLPSLSRHAAALQPVANGKKLPAAASGPSSSVAYKDTLIIGMRMVLLAMLPAMVALFILRVPLITLFFQRGAFDSKATELTSIAFSYYAPQLPFVAIDLLLISAFYARKNVIIPALVGVLGVGVYLAVGVTLMGPMGMAGLALANTMQHTVHATVLFVLLWRAIGGLRGYGLGTTVGKGVIATTAMAAALYLANPFLQDLGASGSAWALGSYLLMAGTLAIAVYAIVLVLLRVEDLDFIRVQLRRWLRMLQLG